MQTSGAGHSLGVSTGRTAGWGSFSGSDVNGEPRLRNARCGGGPESDRAPFIRASGAGTLARTTGVSGDSGLAVAAFSMTDLESTFASSAGDAMGLGDARSAVATSARTVTAADRSVRSGVPTTAIDTIAVDCGAS